MTYDDVIRARFFTDAWRSMCGLPPKPNVTASFESLRETEWSEEFETLRRNRLVLGAFRHGRIGDENKARFDRVSSSIDRLNLYKLDHNAEHLLDVANLAMLEFVEGENTFNAHDDSEHTRELL